MKDKQTLKRSLTHTVGALNERENQIFEAAFRGACDIKANEIQPYLTKLELELASHRALHHPPAPVFNKVRAKSGQVVYTLSSN